MISIERQEWVVIDLRGISLEPIRVDFHNMQDDYKRSIRLNETTNYWERYFAIDAEWCKITSIPEHNSIIHRAYKFWNDNRVSNILLGVNDEED